MVLSLVSVVVAGLGFSRNWGPAPPVAPFTHGPLPKARVVRSMIFPVIGYARWGRGYGVDHSYTRHTGIDIKAPKMTPIVAPFGGTLGMKRESFWIYGDHGWMMLGTHLNDDNIGCCDHRGDRDVMFAPNLRPGMKVKAGQFIGYVGESGMATGPHLHFELYAPGKGTTMSRIRDPFYSLHYAQVLRAPRLALPDKWAKPAKGYIRLQACLRGIDSYHGFIKVILVAKQSPTGATSVVTHPHYVRMKLSKRALKSLGGWRTLKGMPSTRTFGLYLPYTRCLDNALVERARLSKVSR